MSNYPQQPGYPPPGGTPQTPSYQPGYQPPPPTPPWTPPPSPGMGCGTKLLLVLGLLFLLMILACCGGAFGLGYYFRHSITQDPNEVDAIAADFASIDIPKSLEPAGAGRFTVPLTGKLAAIGAVYADRAHGGVLVLVSVGDMFDEKTQATIREKVEEALRQGGPPKRQDENEEELLDRTETHREMTIRGEKATFTIVQGVGARSHVHRIEAHGVFQGKIGPAMLNLTADVEQIPEDKVIKMLESIE